MTFPAMCKVAGRYDDHEHEGTKNLIFGLLITGIYLKCHWNFKYRQKNPTRDSGHEKYWHIAFFFKRFLRVFYVSFLKYQIIVTVR